MSVDDTWSDDQISSQRDEAAVSARVPERLRARSWIGLQIARFGDEEERQRMEQSTQDQIKGTARELKGKVKQKAGQVTNNPNLAAEGQNDKLAGKIQKKVGQIEKVFEK